MKTKTSVILNSSVVIIDMRAANKRIIFSTFLLIPNPTFMTSIYPQPHF